MGESSAGEGSSGSKDVSMANGIGSRTHDSLPTGTGSIRRPTALSAAGADFREIKKSLNLDFNSPTSTKKTLQTPDVLTSLLKLTSPELTKHIIADALAAIHQSKNFNPGSTLLSPGASLTPSESVAVASAFLAASTANNVGSFTPSLHSPSAGSAALSSLGLQPLILPSPSADTTGISAAALASPTRPEPSYAHLGLLAASMQKVASASSLPSNHTLESATALSNFLHQQQSVNNYLQKQQQQQQQQAAAVNVLLSMHRQGFAEPPPPRSLEAQRGDAISRLVTASSYVEAGASSSYVPQHPSSVPSSHYGESRASSAHSSAAPSPCPFPSSQASSSGSLLGPAHAYHPGPLSIKTEETEGHSGPASHVSSVDSLLDTVPSPYTNQEAAKLERKRQRNRLAASKCRKRKIERISGLEGEKAARVAALDARNAEVRALTADIARLRQTVAAHRQAGCPLPPPTLVQVSKN